jgi:hypothetical protein
MKTTRQIVFNERLKTGARAQRSTYTRFEQFRRELIHTCTHDGILTAIAAGRALRKRWASNVRLRVTFGAGQKALDSMVEIQRNGKRVFRAIV